MTARVRNETELIEMYLAPLAADAPGSFGLKDDAALIEMEPGFDLVVSTDPVIEGVHFFADDNARDVAWKALAVNASDIAAKGADAHTYTMAMAFPQAPERTWMAEFCAGLREAQSAFGYQLIGGDSDRTPGPLSIAITAFGKIPRGRMVHRQNASPGDHVFVSGTLGDASLGLMLRQSPDVFGKDFSIAHKAHLLGRYLRPQARVELARVLRDHASASLDVSDGLVKDATRLAVGAEAALSVNVTWLPLSAAARAVLTAVPEYIDKIVAGGDDYEILCAVPPSRVDAFRKAAAVAGVSVTQIGILTAGVGASISRADGTPILMARTGFDHFGGN